jgi:hypothetical protein
MRAIVVGLALVVTLTVGFFLGVMAQLGYEDTPFLPGQKWRVHDSKRPSATCGDSCLNSGQSPIRRCRPL